MYYNYFKVSNIFFFFLGNPENTSAFTLHSHFFHLSKQFDKNHMLVCWFCTLKLRWVHLLVLTVFLVETLGVCMYKIMSSANRSNFNFFLSNLDAFISFSYLIALARAFCTMLNRSGENIHTCLISNCKEKLLIFYY